MGVEAPPLCSFLGVPFLLTDVGQLLGHYVSTVMRCLEALKSIQKDDFLCFVFLPRNGSPFPSSSKNFLKMF